MLLLSCNINGIHLKLNINEDSTFIENETPVHSALLLYKAKVLRGLGLLDAARDTLTGALRRKKGRSEELLRALRYERALVYEDLGQRRRARSELEKPCPLQAGLRRDPGV